MVSYLFLPMCFLGICSIQQQGWEACMCQSSVSSTCEICQGSRGKDQGDCGRNLFRTGWKTSAQQALTFTGAISSSQALRKESETFFSSHGLLVVLFK